MIVDLYLVKLTQKGLRTVKTCVGNTWCRFGTQNSMGMGVIIEKLT